MMLTGAMVLIAPGSPVQLLVAIFVVLIFLLLVLKVAPFVDNTDDWLSFLCSFQMLVTLLSGFAMLTDNKEGEKKFPSNSMGPILIVMNSMAFVALAISILLLLPKCRQKVNGGNSDESKESKQKNNNKTAVVPIENDNNNNNDQTRKKFTAEEDDALKNWGVSSDRKK